MNRFRLSLFVVVVLFIISFAFAKNTQKILMIIASQNFRDEELLIPKKLFEKEGYEVTIASTSLKPCKGMLGAVVTPQVVIDEVKVDDYSAVVFVGGVGAQEYFNHPGAHRIAKEGVSRGKIIGAICLAPVILAEAGVLKGKKATVWASEGKTLEAKGAHYTGKSVEVDGDISTASGPQAAEEFGKSIISLLKSRK